MPFDNIKDLFGEKAKSDHYYFLDANVWIYAMNTSCMPTAKDKGNSIYTDFFFSLVDSEVKPRPRIVMCNLLISEIINTYLKKYALPDYITQTYTLKGDRPPANFDYKLNYRITEHFMIQYALIRNEIKSYNQSIHLIDDSFNELKPYTILKSCPRELDFNDYYYFLLFKKFSQTKSNASFITNDGDFKFTDFEILTRAKSLLDLKKR